MRTPGVYTRELQLTTHVLKPIMGNAPLPVWRNGRRSRLKICRPQKRAGSSPATGTISPGTEDTILPLFFCFIDSCFLNTIRLQEYESLSHLSEMEQLEEMDSLLASLPKFPLELTLDELGDFRIVPAFTSVFESAYYALAQFVATGSEVPLRDGGRTPLQVCASCGKMYYKSENRQKYCDEIECKKERNRRKANRYAAKMREQRSVES